MSNDTLPQRISVVATGDDVGRRLDQVLAHQITGMSRSRLQDLVRQGLVTVNTETITDPAIKVQITDQIVVTVPPPKQAKPGAENISLTVVYEDEHLIVIDKPAGLVVHPAPGHHSGTLVNALLAHCGDSLSGIGGERRPGIVHRLDKDTSGLLVVAKSDAAHQGLARQFAAHGRDGKMHRRYEALVWGTLPRPAGSISAALGRSSANRLKIAVVDSARGQHAVTHYEVMETFDDAAGKPAISRLKLTLETGRTHQIRVHMAHIGHPVVADPVYASGFKTLAERLQPQARDAVLAPNRQALHANELGFEHPVTKHPLSFKSPLPKDIQAIIDHLTCRER